ncbi:MAG TPA: alanine racemase [Candidatus Limnocylindrales bacterium]|nr:alanine racemase [Candidatus Limnocylindrales bacterium]
MTASGGAAMAGSRPEGKLPDPAFPVPWLPENLDTPALVVDLDVAEANTRRLVQHVAARGATLRPHAKTHKSLEIARGQLAAGAVGLTVGTLGEAEVFVAGGFDDLFIAYPVWAAGPKAARLRALHEAAPRMRVGVDSVAGAERLAAAVAGTVTPLQVVIEIDPGNRRTGVATPEAVIAVARAAATAGLDVLGVFSHGGHGYASPAARQTAAADEVRVLTAACEALRTAGFECRVVSAGSTPTMLDALGGPITEMRAGTYVLGDRQQAVLGSIGPDTVALHVAATVVSEAVPGQVVVDAGAKTLTKDVAPYLLGHGALPAYPEAVIERLSDYHGVVRVPSGSAAPRLGEVVAIVPNHVCPVVDLFDSLVGVRGSRAVGTLAVDARGRRG